MPTPQYKNLRRTYGFDEVAIVPGDVTINPDQTATDFKIGDFNFSIPIIGAAMDAVTDINMAIKMNELGGLAVLHLEGVQTRCDDPDAALADIAAASQDKVTALMQDLYSRPIKEERIGLRVKKVKDSGSICAVSVTPANTKWLAPLAIEAGADIIFISSTVTTARHESSSMEGLKLEKFTKEVNVPVVVGNCVSYSACLELMRTGVACVLIGVGPGAACTTREVLGVGVPQITATMDCAAAREDYMKESGRYVPIVTDGGFRKGGDICKAVAAGADAVMLGSILAQAESAPGKGRHWGMANPHKSLPRGTRIKVGTSGTLEQILFGPTSRTDGTQNLVGALRTAMGTCSARNIKEMHRAEMVIAPSITTEGKFWQITQQGK
ncbi:MAG: GuaB3 family IMP dehydrogenase-related protein [Chloroflexi bacterium]|nr:GuaB3 family IMP dehydrogenase-related protein [Chloroflexota bacterium]